MTSDIIPMPGAHAPPELPRHVFADPVDVPADQSCSGKNQTERACVLCSIVKVTVFDGEGRAHREWRYPNTSVQLSDDFRPVCIPSQGKVA